MPIPSISLLWPPGTPDAVIRQAARLTGSTAADLDLERTVTALSEKHGFAQGMRAILGQLCADLDTIRYRQAVVADLADHPDLVSQLETLLPQIISLDDFPYAARPDQSPLHEVVWRVGQLETYVECVQGMGRALAQAGGTLRAAGLVQLRDTLAAVERDEVFQNLVRELPAMLEQVRSIASISIGVNLDHDLRPVEATLLSVNARKYRGSSPSLFTTLFGAGSSEEWNGIARLHTASENNRRAGLGGEFDNPMLQPLFRDLGLILKRVSGPVARALQKYIRVNTQFLSDLGAELAFFLGAARLVHTIRACGLPLCLPDLAPADERVCEVEGAYNLNLALRLLAKNGRQPHSLAHEIVANDVSFGPAGRIFVLTGPNQGGKTTYTQAVGLIQVLAQAGLYVPGRRARLSPVDGIYTHFPVEERPDTHAGRLGEEAKRLSDIFAHATRHSLVLLNESLSSTSPGEGLYLAQDLVRILRVLGARGIYATHLHDLATGHEALNADTPGDSLIASLVSLAHEGSGGVRQTYRIVLGPPRGHSYAREIAARYGISYDQLTDLLRARGLLDGG